MSFRNGAYATVWEVKPAANYTDVRLSTSRKSKQSGEYETDFSGFVRFIGDANRMAAGLKQRDRIKLGEVACTNQYVKDKNTTYHNYQCFNFEAAESISGRSQDNPAAIPAGVTAEELPFN